MDNEIPLQVSKTNAQQKHFRSTSFLSFKKTVNITFFPNEKWRQLVGEERKPLIQYLQYWHIHFPSTSTKLHYTKDQSSMTAQHHQVNNEMPLQVQKLNTQEKHFRCTKTFLVQKHSGKIVSYLKNGKKWKMTSLHADMAMSKIYAQQKQNCWTRFLYIQKPLHIYWNKTKQGQHDERIKLQAIVKSHPHKLAYHQRDT